MPLTNSAPSPGRLYKYTSDEKLDVESALLLSKPQSSSASSREDGGGDDCDSIKPSHGIVLPKMTGRKFLLLLVPLAVLMLWYLPMGRVGLEAFREIVGGGSRPPTAIDSNSDSNVKTMASPSVTSEALATWTAFEASLSKSSSALFEVQLGLVTLDEESNATISGDIDRGDVYERKVGQIRNISVLLERVLFEIKTAQAPLRSKHSLTSERLCERSPPNAEQQTGTSEQDKLLMGWKKFKTEMEFTLGALTDKSPQILHLISHPPHSPSTQDNSDSESSTSEEIATSLIQIGLAVESLSVSLGLFVPCVESEVWKLAWEMRSELGRVAKAFDALLDP